jgi:predicted amidophosphoribosyltransferase
MSFILDLIFPKKCLICGSNGQYLCPKCLSFQHHNQPKYINQGSKERSLSLFRYEFLIKKAIFELKYHFVTNIIDELALVSANHIKSSFPHLLSILVKE